MQRILFCVILVFGLTDARAQFDIIKQKIEEKKNSQLISLVVGTPPVTTSLKDAIYEAPELDHLQPEKFSPLGEMPLSTDGGFFLLPGFWEFNAESYCLMAGTYGSKKGEGFSYAPLEGPKAGIIKSLVTNAKNHPEIEQRDIQVLIWSIISQTKITDIDPKYLNVAKQLLSPTEMLNLASSGLAPVRESIRNKIIESLPPVIQKIVEAENNLRKKLSAAKTTYEELENIAVIPRNSPLALHEREVVNGRWSKHPDGYYIRYFSDSYKETKIQLYIPKDLSLSLERIHPAENYIQFAALTESHPNYNYYRQLKSFDPSGGMAVPPRPRQRQLPSGRKSKNPNSIDKAREVIGYMNTAKDVVDFASADTWVEFLGGKLGDFGPSSLFDNILEFNFDNWGKAASALEGDPPRNDFTEIAKAEKISLPPFKASEIISTEMAEQLNQFMDATLTLNAQLQAMAISVDRHGGALLNKNAFWTQKQALAVVYFKKKVGESLIKFVNSYQPLIEKFRTLKPNYRISPQKIKARQDQLRENGFSADELKAAKMLGLTDQQIEMSKQSRLNFNPTSFESNYSEFMLEMLESMNKLGNHLTLLPDIPERELYQ